MQQKIKYLGTNLTKDVKDLYTPKTVRHYLILFFLTAYYVPAVMAPFFICNLVYFSQHIH